MAKDNSHSSRTAEEEGENEENGDQAFLSQLSRNQMLEEEQVPRDRTAEHRHSSTTETSGYASDATQRNIDDNVFQALLRIALAALMAFVVATQGLFISAAQSVLEPAEEMMKKEVEEAEEEAETNKKGTKATSSSSHFPSSSSSSSEEEAEADEKKGKKKPVENRTPPKIDTEKLLQTDHMDSTMLIAEERASLSSVPESPPLQIETIGVHRDKMLAEQQRFAREFQTTDEEEEEGGGGGTHTSPSPFVFFHQQMAPDEKAEEEEEEDVEGKFVSRLDAIVEEDSDELRSAQSSRASTARRHQTHQQKRQAEREPTEEEEDIEEDQYPPPPFPHLVFLREQSDGGLSRQSSGARVEELQTPEEEEAEKNEEVEGTRSKSGEEQPKVPRLDLSGPTPETPTTTEEEESPSETDTVLVKDEEGEQEELLEDGPRKETAEKKNNAKMFHPIGDADRDQGEFVEAMTDQQISTGHPLEHTQSPSISITLDRSRDSDQLDHSLCSDLHVDESQIADHLIMAHQRAMGPLQEEQTPRAEEYRNVGKASEKETILMEKRDEEMFPPPPMLPQQNDEARTVKPSAFPERIAPIKPSVTPLWGRNERIVGHPEGYMAEPSMSKRREGKENNNVEEEERRTTRMRRTKEEEERHRRTDDWTVHPIMLKDMPGPKQQRLVPIQITTTPWTQPVDQQPWRASPLLSSPKRVGTDWTTTTTSTSAKGHRAQMADHPPQPPTIYPSTAGTKPSSPFDQYSRDSSPLRDDFYQDAFPLMSSAAGHYPRPGVRDIPIQRSASAFTPAGSGLGAPVYSGRTVTGMAGPNEYYRREVLTRTLVTRSSEALSAAPQPLGRSSPVTSLLTLEQPPPRKHEVSEEYWLRYSRNIEEEERRIREAQDRRRKDEEERRRRVEEQRRRWEQQEMEELERLRRERERMEQALEAQALDRERAEKARIAQDRAMREAAEKRRREEWEHIEHERRLREEAELEKQRQLERLERERLERERLEAERLERERMEALRKEQERLEQQRLEQERIERERLEIERLEIERIERIKREQKEKEAQERERQKQEAERLAREREELERLERERIEIERQAMELLEKERREEEERERERREEALREARRREEERREREALERAEREAAEREMARRARERAEQERLEALRLEQERLEKEQLEADRRERQRQEEERRERELLEASQRAKERRERERLEEMERERQRQEEERREQERRLKERLEAQERERQRQLEEQRERDRLLGLEAAAAERRALRAREDQRTRERAELERRAEELREHERREQERRERERQEEERRLAELREAELRNAEQRERERREAQEREERRRQNGWRSRERLEELARERDEKERWEAEKRRLLAGYEQEARKRQALTSKETLERLTRKPYYSREDLTQAASAPPPPPIGIAEYGTRRAEPADMTTKVERQVIERVDRTLWRDADLHRPAGMPPASAYYGTGILPSLLDSVSAEESARERMYRPRDPADEEFLRRGGSQRTSKYRARMEKARKEFIQGGAPPPEPLQSLDPVSDRFRRSTEELRRRVEYRGPLLQRFNSGEFAHPPLEPYPSGLGRSPYEQGEHRRSRSVLDHSPRQSRREMVGQPESDAVQHSRSKSADYLTDPRRPLDEAHIPENDLQKSAIGLPPPPPPVGHAPPGEHELRFRKSAERIHAPEWYRDHHPLPSPMTTVTSGVYSGATSAGMARPSDMAFSSSAQRPWSYLPPPASAGVGLLATPGSPPVGGIAFPMGMFDKYKDEIEDLRRSRTSLHQLGAHEHGAGTTKSPSEPSLVAQTQVTREYSREAFSKTEVSTYPSGGQQLPGYTVSTVPSEWRVDRKNSRVVEVADTFVDRHPSAEAPLAQRYGGRITLEEALDAILQATRPAEELPPADPGIREQQIQLHSMDGPGIFTPDQALMDRLSEQPHLAESLLRNQPLFIRCAHCHLVRSLRDAGHSFCWCRHCYTYYCSRQCRLRDWERHRDRCSFARINSLCKEVIMKVRRDPETQFHMSRVAREGYRREGRGSVNIRLISAYSAQLYLDQGWRIFGHDPNQLLFYYPIQALIDQRKEPSLIQLCKKYNPNEKFILSVSVIADIEQCPETPPPTEPLGRDRGVAMSSPSLGNFLFGGTTIPTNV